MAVTYHTPGIYIEEVSRGARPIEGVGTSTAAFVGHAPAEGARVHDAVAINNWSQFVREFVPEGSRSTALSHAIFGFFQNGGRRCYVVNVGAETSVTGGGRTRKGVDVLETVDEVAIVAAPGFADASAYDALLSHCEKLKDRVAILDAPCQVPNIEALTQVGSVQKGRRREGEEAEETKGLRPRVSPGGYGAFYYPCITVRDSLPPNELVDIPPSGHIAGIYARNDATRGVHKAPANEPVRGALNVTYRVTDEEQGLLNQNGVNCLRFFSREGVTVYGARTVAEAASEWRYVNVRRLFNMVEESIARGTRWTVFEPNDPSLWKAIRRDVGSFLTRVWRDGALMGATPEEAFFVKCDEETNPPDVIEAGMVVILVGMAPVKPAEFVVFRISQHAAGVEIE
ncbi:MAG: phage tail sheath family protein [Gemmatimonadetes bacterium]|nr:phage tail sheath family protein [Gemmatimonadota bacterium]